MAKTKVVFIKDSPPYGRAGDVRDVAGGFFRNLLFPQGIAVFVTSDRIREAEIKRTRRKEAVRLGLERMETYAKELESVTLEFVKKANEQGGLFDALDKREILEALHEKGFAEIEEKHIDMGRPFDKIGEYTINLQLGPARTTEVIRSGGGDSPTLPIKIVIIEE